MYMCIYFYHVCFEAKHGTSIFECVCLGINAIATPRHVLSLHVVGALEQGRRNSPGTKGERRGLFCN
jgi:hypothetical protein